MPGAVEDPTPRGIGPEATAGDVPVTGNLLEHGKPGPACILGLLGRWRPGLLPS